jgi:hypothetical protein
VAAGRRALRGKADIVGSARPIWRQEFVLDRITACHGEYTIRYDNHPTFVVGIMEFRDGKVVRERINFGDPWEPREWRAQGSSPSTRAADAQGGWSRPPRVRIPPPPLQERASWPVLCKRPVPAAGVSRRRP